MKRNLLIIGGVFITLNASAQFTDLNEPQIGHNQMMYVVDSTVTNFASITGDGVEWDYSQITGYGDTATRMISVMDAADTLNSGMFNHADFAIDIEGFFTSYFKKRADGRDGVGFVFNGDGLGVGYVSAQFFDTTPETMMDYPFNYGDVVNIDAEGELTLNLGMPTTLSLPAVGISTVDGRGTLKLSTDEYTNVLRYHLLDTMVLELTPDMDVLIIRDQYEYYDHTVSNLPLFLHLNVIFSEVMTDGTTGVEGNVGIVLSYNDPEGTSAVENNIWNGLVVYPNPAKDLLTITLPNQVDNASMNIVDVTGRSLYFDRIMDGSSVNVSNFDSGVYFVKITHNGQTITRSIVID
ncbi:MAG: T9SS type A sorting domain-containing protein [Brumimicrobium sp.]